MFDPKTNKFPYPDDTSNHYIIVRKDKGIKFGENYLFIDESFHFKFNRFLIHILLRLIVFPINRLRLGLVIKNKHILKANKDLLVKGAISVSNHVHFWDYICLMQTLHHHKWPRVIVWDKNVNGENGTLIRLVGGIPIPKNDNKASLKFVESCDNFLKNNGILHIYSEGSMWEYYAPIRPFHLGAASFAVRNNKPILPLAFSYRKPSWIRRKIFRQIALLTLNIGEPLFADTNLDKTKQIRDLTIRCHQAICRLSGNDENNIYSPIYNNSKRVEYY